jgi:hypothetical protein
MLRSLAFAAFVAAQVLADEAAPPQFNLFMLQNTDQTGAVCIDGTPGGFYYQPGSGADVNNWVSLFEHSISCSAHERCKRSALLTSRITLNYHCLLCTNSIR